MKAFREWILALVMFVLFGSIVVVPSSFVIERIIIPELRSFLLKIEWLDRNSIQPIMLMFGMNIILPMEIILFGILLHKTSFGRKIIHRLNKGFHFTKKVSDEKKETDQEK